MFTWHFTVRTGRHVARRAAAGLAGHAAGHRVQDQDDSVDQCRVRSDQPEREVRLCSLTFCECHVILVFGENSHVQQARVCKLNEQIFILEHTCEMNELIRDGLISTNPRAEMRFKANEPNATGSELSPGEAAMICSSDSLLASILNT